MLIGIAEIVSETQIGIFICFLPSIVRIVLYNVQHCIHSELGKGQLRFQAVMITNNFYEEKI